MKRLFYILDSIFVSVIFGIIILGVGGCSTIRSLTTTVPTIIERESIVLPDIPSATQYPYKWIVITPDNVIERLAEIKNETGSSVILSITPDDYTNLNSSIGELRKYIEGQDAVINAYKQYYDKLPPKIVAEPAK